MNNNHAEIIEEIYTLSSRYSKLSETDIKHLIELKKSLLPNLRLYRYRPIHDLDRMALNYFLTNEYQLYLSSPIKFNDPYDTWLFAYLESCEHYRNRMISEYRDGLIELGYSDEEIVEYTEFTDSIEFEVDWEKQFQPYVENIIATHKYDVLDYPQIKQLVEEEIHKKLEMELDSVGIICFSSENDSLLLWSYYAEGHTGFCLEYNLDPEYYSDIKEKERVEHLWKCILPIKYTAEPKPALDDITNVEYPDNIFEVVKKYATIKSPQWEHEKEWRYIAHLEEEYDLDSMINFLKPSCIYAGAKMPYYNRFKLQEIGAKMGDIQIRIMERKVNNFELISREAH